MGQRNHHKQAFIAMITIIIVAKTIMSITDGDDGGSRAGFFSHNLKSVMTIINSTALTIFITDGDDGGSRGGFADHNMFWQRLQRASLCPSARQ